ncbi:MAG TPA: pyruvate, water dikinase regulatory protein [Prolixibacteraceae bacterium]|nr:pyruvate, water dikinase regulatory protein [Prolixibacteraceae bacterium]HPR85319.1 pyruvate, water dikinase regulatory protein [Prolixibacteraceae bacterium]
MEAKRKENSPNPIYVVSGGKGLAGNNMVQSLLIQYPNNNVPVIIVPNMTEEHQLTTLVKKAKAEGGLITHTMVNRKLRNFLNELCRENNVKCIDYMGELADYLDQKLDIESLQYPGLYREINQEYFDRIDAIEFTLNHDDGLSPGKLHKAEIVLTGVSRSGKTPLSVYLAMYGWKVANIPLVMGIDPPGELFEVDPKRVFGLNISSGQLISHRMKRLISINNTSNTTYVDERMVQQEIRNANFIFERGGFTVLNVSNKPVETTANEILNMMAERFEYRGRRLDSPYPDEVKD